MGILRGASSSLQGSPRLPRSHTPGGTAPSSLQGSPVTLRREGAPRGSPPLTAPNRASPGTPRRRQFSAEPSGASPRGSPCLGRRAGAEGSPLGRDLDHLLPHPVRHTTPRHALPHVPDCTLTTLILVYSLLTACLYAHLHLTAPTCSLTRSHLCIYTLLHSHTPPRHATFNNITRIFRMFHVPTHTFSSVSQMLSRIIISL